jgi:phasin protein
MGFDRRDEMARGKQNPTTERFARGPGQLEAGGQRAAEFWVGNQAIAFECIDEAARRWLERRQQSLDATREAFDEMRECDNIGDLLRIQQEWTVGSMQRLAADFAEFGKMTLNLAENATYRMNRATETVAGT